MSEDRPLFDPDLAREEVWKKDERYLAAKEKYKRGAWVYLTETGVYAVVRYVRATADGPRVKTEGAGSVPVEELRPATDEEVEAHFGDQRFKIKKPSRP